MTEGWGIVLGSVVSFYRGVRRRGLLVPQGAGEMSESLHCLLMSLDGRLDGLKTSTC